MGGGVAAALRAILGELVETPKFGEPLREDVVDLVYRGGVTNAPPEAVAERGVSGLRPKSLRCSGVRGMSVNSSAGRRNL